MAHNNRKYLPEYPSSCRALQSKPSASARGRRPGPHAELFHLEKGRLWRVSDADLGLAALGKKTLISTQAPTSGLLIFNYLHSVANLEVACA